MSEATQRELITHGYRLDFVQDPQFSWARKSHIVLERKANFARVTRFPICRCEKLDWSDCIDTVRADFVARRMKGEL